MHGQRIIKKKKSTKRCSGGSNTKLTVCSCRNIFCAGQFTSCAISNVNAALPAPSTPIAISEHLQLLHTAAAVMTLHCFSVEGSASQEVRRSRRRS